MKRDPWGDAAWGLEILFDVSILLAAIMVGWFGVYVQAPVLVFAGAIFIATSLCWLVADLWRAARLKGVVDYIDTVGPEVGLTFLYSRKYVSACIYTGYRIVTLSLHWGK